MVEQDSTKEIIVPEIAQGVAVTAAITAARQVLKYWPNPTNPDLDKARTLDVFDKAEGVGNYATIADKESEKIIIDKIQAEPLLAGHRIIAEESDEITTSSEWQWVIDPIDGTPPFRNGLPEFGISIGLLKNGDPALGVIAMPALGQLVVGQKGKGAQLQDFDGEVVAELGQGEEIPLNKALIAYDLGYQQRGNQLEKAVVKIADRIGYPVSYGSSSTANFRLACGLLSGYFYLTPTKFDIAAAAAIIPEIGGIVTDLHGNPINWSANNQTYLAARTPERHAELLDLLNAA